MTWDYSAINHWWVAFGGDDRVWKITVDAGGMFLLHEGQELYNADPTLQLAKAHACLAEANHLQESIHA